MTCHKKFWILRRKYWQIYEQSETILVCYLLRNVLKAIDFTDIMTSWKGGAGGGCHFTAWKTFDVWNVSIQHLRWNKKFWYFRSEGFGHGFAADVGDAVQSQVNVDWVPTAQVILQVLCDQLNQLACLIHQNRNEKVTLLKGECHKEHKVKIMSYFDGRMQDFMIRHNFHLGPWQYLVAIHTI